MRYLAIRIRFRKILRGGECRIGQYIFPIRFLRLLLENRSKCKENFLLFICRQLEIKLVSR